MTISKSTVGSMLPYLNEIASQHGLRLNRAKEFKMARMILANRYMH